MLFSTEGRKKLGLLVTIINVHRGNGNKMDSKSTRIVT